MVKPAIAPKADAANVVPNDKPAANPIEGAKNVFINDAKTIESIFQNIFLLHQSKNIVSLHPQNTPL